VGLLDRIRGEGAPVETADGSNGLVDRLGSIARRGGQLAGAVADGVKEATPRRLLRDAMDAQARGNLGAAFFLARESVEAEPGDPEADGFFWDVALGYGEPGVAAESAARLVTHHAAHDAPELAAQFFRELVTSCEPALVEPSVLVRLLPDLVASLEAADAEADEKPDDPEAASDGALSTTSPEAHRAAVHHALTMCVHPENTTLSPGLAMRVAELARDFDTEVALEAAHRALAADDVHETKRAKLVALIRELDPEAELAEGEEALEVDEADLAAVSIELEADFSDAAPAADMVEAPDIEAVPIDVEGEAPLEVHLEPQVEVENDADAATLVAPDPATVPISDAESDRLTSFLEPEEDEVVSVGDFTDSIEVDDIEVLPELDPIDEQDPSRNHPSRIESPAHEALSDDDVDRMRARIERALGTNAAAATGETEPVSGD